MSAHADVVSRLRAAGCVFAEDEAALLFEAAAVAPSGEVDAGALEQMVRRRVEGAPLEHILGWAEFAGLRVRVGPGVFVPRRRTEALVEAALAFARLGCVVLDLCCGSGAVGTAIEHAGRDRGLDLEVYAADLDPAAVAVARRNLPADRPRGSQRAGAERVFEGDLYAALPDDFRGRIDLLVVNAPYVPTEAIATMPPEARLHEALLALDGGDDGLDVQRRVVQDAPAWLAASGRLLIETSEQQAPATAALMAAAGLHTAIERSEEVDGTVVIGSRR